MRRLETISRACNAALLKITVRLLDYRQVFPPFGVRKFKGTSFAWVPYDDLGVVIPVDTQQTLQVAIICILSGLIQQGLYAVVLDMFPSGNDGEYVE